MAHVFLDGAIKGCVVIALAGCGDAVVRPLYTAPERDVIDAGAVDSIVTDASDDVDPRPCSTDQALSLITSTPSNVARPGAIYSAPPLDGYVPRPIAVRLSTAAGTPVQGCDIVWSPAAASGWVFPNGRSTDADGRADAWWTAGDAAAQSVVASVTDDKGGVTSTTIAGTAEPKRTRATRVYLQYPAGSYDGYSAEVIPERAPAGSNFAALWTSQCGAGIDNGGSTDGGLSNRAFAFCWDTNTEATTILNQAGSTCNAITSSTGLRGTFCSFPFAWQLEDAYLFEVTARQPVSGHTDYSFFVTTTKTGQRLGITELRVASARLPNAASSYLQNDGAAAACLQMGQMAASFRAVRQINGGTTTSVVSATFARDYDVDQNVICANYDYGSRNAAFTLSTGGTQVGRPCPPGWPAPTIVLY